MSVINPWYGAVERFSPNMGRKIRDDFGWDEYIKWSKLNQLTEVISLDGGLCPNFIVKPTREDWEHTVDAEANDRMCLLYFKDLDYLLKRVSENIGYMILALVRSPTEECSKILNDERFVFKGYDLMDKDHCNSALVNCGGFPDIFSNGELSEVGLIPNLSRAKEIERLLREKYPEERHADCNIWALWRLEK